MDKEVDKIKIKRVITVKAIVTENFKKSLLSELKKTRENINIQIMQIESEARVYLEQLKQSGDLMRAQMIEGQLAETKERYTQGLEELNAKIAEAERLVYGTLYPQGQLEGEVEISTGDDLYKKIAGAEIIVKDGIVEKIVEQEASLIEIASFSTIKGPDIRQ
ncbi:MAG: YlqD family protein [Deltaproteobacteria bacterium]|nr:YlqD family protein [Deltaproteobacteria bacterium]